MADMLGSCTGVSQKRKLEHYSDDSDDLFDYFYNEYEYFDNFVDAYLYLLTDINHALLPSVITSDYCDAYTLTRRGISFNNSECQANPDTSSPFHFGAFFVNGVKIYNNIIQKQIPEEKDLKIVASKLLRFLLEIEWHDELRKIGDSAYVTGDTQVMVTLAEHLFSRLSVHKEYVIDRFANKSDICKCGRCKTENLKFGDTSIGHPKVWHGSMDIVFESCKVAVSVPKLEEDRDTGSDGRSTVEIKSESLDSLQTRSQIIAQTIVFSMLHKHTHPVSQHFLIPNITANAQTLKFFFYDAGSDVLLESRKYELVCQKLPYLLVFETVITTWLVLNHKVLCSGPYAEFKTKAPKSKFKEFAGEALSIYESELKYRNVSLEKKQPQTTFCKWQLLKLIHPKGLAWPESLVEPPNPDDPEKESF